MWYNNDVRQKNIKINNIIIVDEWEEKNTTFVC
jgi:hypothetical protein